MCRNVESYVERDPAKRTPESVVWRSLIEILLNMSYLWMFKPHVSAVGPKLNQASLVTLTDTQTQTSYLGPKKMLFFVLNQIFVKISSFVLTRLGKHQITQYTMLSFSLQEQRI